jgi:hypothetical protein
MPQCARIVLQYMYMCIAPRNFTQAVARYNDVLVYFEIPFRLVCNLVYHTQIKNVFYGTLCVAHTTFVSAATVRQKTVPLGFARPATVRQKTVCSTRNKRGPHQRRR